MKAKLSIAGLAVLAFTAFPSSTFCSARPKHVRGHRHGDHVHRDSASSGSSVYTDIVGITCKLSVASPYLTSSAGLTLP